MPSFKLIASKKRFAKIFILILISDAYFPSLTFGQSPSQATGSSHQRTNGGGSPSLERREAKLKKLGIKPAKVALIMKRERKFETDRADLAGETPNGSAAEKKLLAKHEAYLKQALGAKMFAAYYMSGRHWEDRRQLASSGSSGGGKGRGLKKAVKPSVEEPNFNFTDDPLGTDRPESRAIDSASGEARVDATTQHHPASVKPSEK